MGFYSKGLRIECCSHFAFLTVGKGESTGNVQKNRINLLLMDPFYEETQVAHFRSSTSFECELQAQCDAIITSVIQSTMGKKRDKKFKTYIWTQFPQQLVRSSVFKCTNGQLNNQDSDEANDLIEIDEEEDIKGKLMFQPIRMVLNERDFIYYITKQNGKCYIMEGNPRD
jgi:hypothetical protein